MTNANRATLDSVYQRFGSGDIEAFIELLAPDFVSIQSDAPPWRGTYYGHDGVRDLFARVASHVDATFEPHEIIDGGDRLVVLGTATITPHASGQTHTVRELHVWSIEDGTPRSLDVFLNASGSLLDAAAQS